MRARPSSPGQSSATRMGDWQASASPKWESREFRACIPFRFLAVMGNQLSESQGSETHGNPAVLPGPYVVQGPVCDLVHVRAAMTNFLDTIPLDDQRLSLDRTLVHNTGARKTQSEVAISVDTSQPRLSSQTLSGTFVAARSPT